MVFGFLLAVAALWGTIGVLGWTPQLGLDLRGGISITLLPAEGQQIDDEVLDQTVQVIRQRVDGLGVAEPEIARQGDTVLVQLPGLTDREQAEEVIGRTAQLQFRRVVDFIPPGTEEYDETDPCDDVVLAGPPDPDAEVVLCGSADAAAELGDDLPGAERPKFRLGTVELTGAQVEDAAAGMDDTGLGGNWVVQLELDGEGGEVFQQVTSDLACDGGQFAVVLDGVVESTPGVNPTVQCGVGIAGGQATITTTGQDDARDLALVLRTGALPIQLEFATSQSVSPTLGSASLTAGLQAGLLGLLLVAAYLIALYRGIGVAAVIELVMFGLITLGIIVVLGNTLGFTLTLAGVAGLIVSVGLAADSSILFRERYRDELRAGRTIRTAPNAAFANAWRTNLTGNTVSFLAAVVLYVLAVGPVRGFAFTLGLATLVDTALFGTFTRALFGLLTRSPSLAQAGWMGLRADDLSAPATGRRA